MELFINEWSFRSQFYEQRAFDSAVAKLVMMVERARRATQGRRATMWRSNSLAEVCAVRDEPLRSSLNHIADHDVRDAFRDVVFNKANAAPWNDERRHHDDVPYTWEREPGVSEDVGNTSMAELAERRLMDSELHGCLLNLVGSPLGGLIRITVVKAATLPVELWSFETEQELSPWLDEALGVVPYPNDAREPPRDEQTCLRDAERFEPVPNFLVQGRQVYRHLARGELYYVDNLHSGGSAHLEVFDKRGRNHRGEADLEGGLRPDTRDKTKKPIQ